MTKLLKPIILVLGLVMFSHAAYGQCGKTVINPSTGKRDCIGYNVAPVFVTSVSTTKITITSGYEVALNGLSNYVATTIAGGTITKSTGTDTGTFFGYIDPAGTPALKCVVSGITIGNWAVVGFAAPCATDTDFPSGVIPKFRVDVVGGVIDTTSLSSWTGPAIATGASGATGNSATVVITNTATTTWAVPTGVNHIRIKLWGAGGGGAAGYNNSRSGAPGAGGGYCETELSVTPEATITIAVGTGGSGGQTNAAAGTDGGNTSFDTLIAYGGGKGGAGGAVGPPGYCNLLPAVGMAWNGTTGVATFVTIASPNSTRPDQGGGSAGSRTTNGAGLTAGFAGQGGGGGGGGAYDNTHTASYAAGAGGSAGLLSGAGGNGGSIASGVIQACTAGTAPGGGGGGGAATDTTFGAGCAGANGRIEISY